MIDALRRRTLSQSFRVAGRELARVRLLGVSRCGNPSWRATLDGVEVKIYRCHGPGQARLIEALASDPVVGRFFPECLLREEPFLAVRWIEGTALPKPALREDPARLARVARLQAALHARPLPAAADAPGFSYAGYLERRWRDFQAFLPVAPALDHLLRVLAEPGREALPVRLSHPDVTPANLVEDAAGELKLVDNELLSAGDDYHVDLLNTHRVLGRRGARRTRGYLEAYAGAGGDLAPLVEHGRFFAALWQLRTIGSLLQDGRAPEAVDAARRTLRGEHERHPLIETARGLVAP